MSGTGPTLSGKVGPTVIPNWEVTVPILREEAGAYVDGRYVPGATSAFNIQAVVQPSRPEDLAKIEEGRRTSAGISVWTTTELRTADAPLSGGHQPDVLTFDSETWQAQTVSDWDTHGGYHKVICTKVGQ